MRNGETNNFAQIDLSSIQISVVQKFIMNQQEETPLLHKHPCYEIICVNETEGAYFVIVPPHTDHLAIDGREDKVLSVNSFLFTFKEKGCKNDIYNVLKNCDEIIKLKDTFNGLERMNAIQSLVGDKSYGSVEQLTAEFQLLLVLICRTLGKITGIEHKKEQTLDEKRLGVMEDYFTYNFSNPECSKRELSKLLGVCERQLTRIIERRYNSTFSQVLLSMRMNMADALLKEKKLSVEEVANKVGYQSTSSFQRAYKKFKSKRTEQ